MVSQWVGPVPVNIVFITFCVQHHLHNRNLNQQPQVKVPQSNVISRALNSAVAAFEGAFSGPCFVLAFLIVHTRTFTPNLGLLKGNGGTFLEKLDPLYLIQGYCCCSDLI